MKKRLSVVQLIVALVVLAASARAQGTEADLSSFLAAQKSDANKLIGAFLSPAIKGLSYGMTSGWYNTAQAHKIGGIDLGVSLAVVNMPTSEETFDPYKLGLSANTVPNNTPAPTFIGPKIPSSYTITNNGYTIANVDGPEGLDFKKNIGMNAIPVPIIQLGVGLIKSTDLKVRYLPEQKQGDSKLGMLGFGLMHDIKQHIPGVKMLPFDLSLLVAYNSISGSTALTNTRVDPVTGWWNQNDGVPYSNNGKANYTFNSWLIQALISKKVAVLTFYAGVGYAAVSSKASLTGTFQMDNPLFQNPQTNPAPVKLTDPFSTTYSNNGFKATAGMRLKLGPIYFSGDYSLQKFNAFTLGFGASIR
ncbi:MAG TPA: DUF6588 family protein [Cyclobacteriaceae bacterium]|jgi:hypothetical protein|nr:DUF6588 family protein [Cyclobacteriaceae bacterium]